MLVEHYSHVQSMCRGSTGVSRAAAVRTGLCRSLVMLNLKRLIAKFRLWTLIEVDWTPRGGWQWRVRSWREGSAGAHERTMGYHVWSCLGASDRHLTLEREEN
jgi:hypothetical protein